MGINYQCHAEDQINPDPEDAVELLRAIRDRLKFEANSPGGFVALLIDPFLAEWDSRDTGRRKVGDA